MFWVFFFCPSWFPYSECVGGIIEKQEGEGECGKKKRLEPKTEDGKCGVKLSGFTQLPPTNLPLPLFGDIIMALKSETQEKTKKNREYSRFPI